MRNGFHIYIAPRDLYSVNARSLPRSFQMETPMCGLPSGCLSEGLTTWSRYFYHHFPRSHRACMINHSNKCHIYSHTRVIALSRKFSEHRRIIFPMMDPERFRIPEYCYSHSRHRPLAGTERVVLYLLSSRVQKQASPTKHRFQTFRFQICIGL